MVAQRRAVRRHGGRVPPTRSDVLMPSWGLGCNPQSGYLAHAAGSDTAYIAPAVRWRELHTDLILLRNTWLDAGVKGVAAKLPQNNLLQSQGIATKLGISHVFSLQSNNCKSFSLSSRKSRFSPSPKFALNHQCPKRKFAVERVPSAMRSCAQ